MYLYGLQPLLVSLVSVYNPNTLNTAIERAKAVETEYNYVPNKALMVQVPPTVVGNPSMPVIATLTIKETTPAIFTTPENAKSKIDALAKQMEQLTLNYANLTSVMLAKEKPRKRNDERPRRIPDDAIICYKCSKAGHIARNCTLQPIGNSTSKGGRSQFRTSHFDTRALNYLDNEGSSEEEAEVYLHTTRARSYNTESRNKQRMRKRIRSGDEMNTDEETYIPAPLEPTPSEPKKKSKRKLKPAPIENVNEFDIAQYISDLPCGLTIGQAAAQIPKYRGGLAKSIRRTREKEANYASDDQNSLITAVKCNLHVDGIPVSVVIDGGAATSIMTRKLMKRLGYNIDQPSKLVIVTANGAKVHSLG